MKLKSKKKEWNKEKNKGNLIKKIKKNEILK